MKLVIKRSQWARGGFNGPSKLLNDVGNMCCLGFLAKECGYSDVQMRGLNFPYQILDEEGADQSTNHFPDGICRIMKTLPSGKPWTNSELTSKLIRINDDDGMSESYREDAIADLMGKLDVQVEFVD